MSTSDWILAIIAVLAVLYWYGTRTFNTFVDACVPYVKPLPYIGNMGPVVFRQLSFPDFTKQLYDQLKGYKFGGVFQFDTPVLLLRDPELIKLVTVKDFDHFLNHRQFTDAETDPLMGNALFNLRGQKWRDMRSTLSPAFTSSKMKAMYPLMMDCGAQMSNYLEMCIKNENKLPPDGYKVEKTNDGLLLVEMKDFYTRYTNDVIATAAFGISVDSLEHPKNEFYLMGKTITNFTGLQALKFFAMMMCPDLLKKLNIKFLSTETSKMLRHLVQDTMETREKKGIVRPDMIHLLMQAKQGTLNDGTTDAKKSKQNWNDDELTAQAVLFFLAGFDTASTLLCFMSHLLAMHPDIQTKLQNEIDEVLRENGGKVAYDALHKMKYLDMVVSESLRLYPPGVLMDRICTKPYTLPTEPPVQIKPGDQLWIPAFAIHRDPELYPDPEKFDPERFSDENKHKINPFAYLPFGSGPRNCIGNRFALMESKMAVFQLLSRFNLKVVPKTPVPIRITRKGLNMTIDGGFWLGLQLRNPVT